MLERGSLEPADDLSLNLLPFEKENGKEKWTEKAIVEAASESVLELAIPFSSIGVARGEEIRLYININGQERGVERWPVKGYLLFKAPDDDFEQQDWIV